jgi:predicted RND superfamily exporter protein
MWQALGKAVLRFRIPLMIALVLLTVFMGYQASKVQMSYDFSRAIPTDHPKYKAYLEFKKTFGEDGNLLTIGFTSKNFFEVDQFNALTGDRKSVV